MHLFDYCPWHYWTTATDDDIARQTARQRELPGLREAGERTFLSPLAAIYDADLAIGDDSYIAAHAYVTGHVRMGDNSTVNPYAVVRGTVSIGSGVRIGAHASLLGFNHSADPGEPIFRQPVTSKGITVGDDVWIGSNAVVLDGVTIGEHSIIGAGAVVTKDVPSWSVMGGNPARRIRDRRDGRAPGGLSGRLEAFARRAGEEAPALLERYDHGAGANIRAVCDTVEIADLLGVELPRKREVTEWLAGLQDPDTGLIPEVGETGATIHSGSNYHILSVGYALDLLGGSLRHPIRAVHELVPDFDALPWADRAWHAGAWVDMYATGLHWNRRWFGLDGPLETLLGWLLLRQDPWMGVWGSPTAGEGRRQPVNGYYRLTRGTFAQFGVPVPRPEETIDTVLAHTRDARWFADGRGTACDVLDVIHPLWLCGHQTGHRRAEAQAWARQRLDDALTRWHTAAGFAFSPEMEPSLMGTEMWLSIIWLLSDILGESGALGYRPRGVHRPEPAYQ